MQAVVCASYKTSIKFRKLCKMALSKDYRLTKEALEQPKSMEKDFKSKLRGWNSAPGWKWWWFGKENKMRAMEE